MGYVEQNLMAGEEVIYRAKLHWVVFFAPAFLGLLGMILIVLGLSVTASWWDEINYSLYTGFLFLITAAIALPAAIIAKKTSEFALTNKRVLIKVGLIRRHSLELLLQKIEGIGVDQSIGGRLFNFGTIVVSGTGGTKEPFKNIVDPLEFRKQVQKLIPH